MKKIIFLLFTNIYAVFYSQSQIQGFNTGYTAGYCYEDYSCVSPVAPIAPIIITPIGQTEYQSGYNAGFAMGLSDKKNNQTKTASKYGNIKTYIPNRTQEYINDGVNRLVQEQAERDRNKIDNYNSQTNNNRSKKVKPEKKNLKLELENKFYDENSLVNQWIISLKEKLVNEYGESEKINSAIQELRDENNLIFDKYFEKKNLPEFYREANILKNKILDFKLE